MESRRSTINQQIVERRHFFFYLAHGGHVVGASKEGLNA